MADKHSEQLNQFISWVPKHLRKFVKHGIFIVPTEVLIENYKDKKDDYLERIKNTKTSSVNSMHKYTSVNPISN
jgi:hypothetical protein